MSIESKRASVDAGERAVAQRLLESETQLREQCEQRGIAWTILRPTLIWGAGSDRSLSQLYRIGTKFGFVPVPVSAGGLRQPVHAADIAHACISALERRDAIARTIALGGSETLPAREMWSRVIACAGARAVPAPGWLMSIGSHLTTGGGPALRAALQRWQQDQVVDNAAAESLLEWGPRGFAPMDGDF